MAIYHCNVQIISRGNGRSALAAAAYRAREKLHDERLDRTTRDYSDRGGLAHAEILLPDHAPSWLGERSKLWSAVEHAESRVNSQLAREFVLALPTELSKEENIRLIRGFSKEQFTSKGMIADMCVHDLGAKNPHAHIMLTLRHVDAHGLKNEKKSARGWNNSEVLKEQRAAWSRHVNHALEQARVEAKVDHRSWKDKGSDRTPEIHLGWYAHSQEQQDIETEQGDHNRRVRQMNSLKEEITDLERQKQENLREQQQGIEKSIQHPPALPKRSKDKKQALYQHQPEIPTTSQEKKLLEQLLDQQRDRERSEPRSDKEKNSPTTERGDATLNQQLENLKDAITEFSATVERIQESKHNQEQAPARKQQKQQERRQDEPELER